MGSSTPDIRPDLAVTSIRIERAKLERFKAVAAGQCRTVSQQLRWLIDQNIDQIEAEEREAA